MSTEEIKSYNSLSAFLRSIGEAGLADRDFVIHRLEAVTPPPPYRSPIFRANYFTFVLVRQGRSFYTLDAREYAVRPHTLYFTNPGHLKAFRMPGAVEGMLISFSESFLKTELAADGFAEFPFLLSEIVPPQYLEEAFFMELWQLGQILLHEQQQSGGQQSKIIGSYFRIFLLKVKERLYQNYDPIEDGGRDSEIVKNFKINLEKHFRDLTSGQTDKLFQVGDFAQLQFLHPNYLTTVIKTKTGKSIHDWISDKVIAEAQAMLRNSSDSVKSIAYKLGFREANYFSKYFKKQLGLTPGQFRKAQS